MALAIIDPVAEELASAASGRASRRTRRRRPENSNSGSSNCEPLTVSIFTCVRSISGISRKKSEARPLAREVLVRLRSPC